MVWVTALYTSHQQTHGGEMTARSHGDGLLSLGDIRREAKITPYHSV
jgi:hypothetical protein